MNELKIEDREAVRVLTMNRPEVLNAFNDALSGQLEAALVEASRDERVHVVILTGEGRGFSAGLDLSDPAAIQRTLMSRAAKLDEYGWVGRLALGVAQCDKPVIAAINGVAAGAGLAVALACDLRFMSDSARVTAGYIRRGLSPDAGMTYFLPRLIGSTRAAEWIFTGRDVHSEEALRVGLVNDVFAGAEFVERVMAFAKSIAAGPAMAMTLSKRLLAASPDMGLPALLKQELTAIKLCLQTADVQEGIRAFMEKREPQFRGE